MKKIIHYVFAVACLLIIAPINMSGALFELMKIGIGAGRSGINSLIDIVTEQLED